MAVSDEAEMYVSVFCRNIALEYLKANEVTVKAPASLSCLFSCIRTDFFIASLYAIVDIEGIKILWDKNSLGKSGSLFPQLFHLYSECFTTKKQYNNPAVIKKFISLLI